MKELDILLERFVSANESSLAAGAWPQFEELLALEDDQLWDCMRQSGADHETAFDSLVTAIRQVSNRNA